MKNIGVRILWLICGVLMVIAGIVCLGNRGLAYATLTMMVGIIMLMSGISDIVMYANCRTTVVGAGWFLADGILTVLLAFIMLFDQFFTAMVIPFIFSFWLMMTGITRLINSFDLKKLGFSGWGWLLALGILMIAFGFISLFSPVATALALGMMVGIVFVFEGVNAVFKAIFYNRMGSL